MIRPYRKARQRRFRTSLGLGLWLACLAITACDRPPEESAPPQAYRVRGTVRQLPVPKRAVRELVVRHEPIPEFKNEAGEVVGMESMTMPFPLSDSQDLAGIGPGDRIMLEFEVSWDTGNPLLVSAIEKLPPETRLSFEAESASE